MGLHSPCTDTHIKYYMCVLSCDRPFATSWTEARQTPLSMGFSQQDYWSGLPFPPPGDLPNPGIEPTPLHLLHWQAGSLPLAPLGSTVTQQLISSVCYFTI